MHVGLHWLHASPGAHRDVGIDLVSLEADATMMQLIMAALTDLPREKLLKS